MNKSIALFIILIFFITCHNKSHKPDYSGLKQGAISQIDTLINCNDEYLFFENITEKSYVLVWGNSSFRNRSKDTMHVMPSGKLNVEWYNKRAICLRQGCGTSCFFAYILPLTPDAKESLYMYPLAYDKLRNLIAYNDTTGSLITVANFITGNRTYINEDFLPGPFAGYCIDSISFTPNRKLFIRWQNSKKVLRSKIFEINEL